MLQVIYVHYFYCSNPIQALIFPFFLGIAKKFLGVYINIRYVKTLAVNLAGSSRFPPAAFAGEIPKAQAGRDLMGASIREPGARLSTQNGKNGFGESLGAECGMRV